MKHPALYCKSYDEYKEEMVLFNKIKPSIEKHNAIVDLRREVERTKREMVEFAKGVKINAVKTKYGEIIKVGINFEEFVNNPITDSGYINFDIKTAKTGKKYAEINNFKPTSNLVTEDVPF